MQQMWQIKEMIALAMLAVCSYTDIKERYIYTVPLLISSAGSVIITVIACALPGYMQGMFMNDLVIPLAAAAVMTVSVRKVKAVIGAGDVYMMAALGMVMGMGSAVRILLAGSVPAAVYSVMMLVAGKLHFRRSIPFAPFVMAGFWAVLLINEI